MTPSQSRKAIYINRISSNQYKTLPPFARYSAYLPPPILPLSVLQSRVNKQQWVQPPAERCLNVFLLSDCESEPGKYSGDTGMGTLGTCAVHLQLVSRSDPHTLPYHCTVYLPISRLQLARIIIASTNPQTLTLIPTSFMMITCKYGSNTKSTCFGIMPRSRGRVRGRVPRITPDSGLVMGLPAVKAHYADIIRRISPTRYHQISARAVCGSPEPTLEACEQWAVVAVCREGCAGRNSSRPELA